MVESNLSDLALIGDRRTAALVSRTGAIVWYCPERFDKPAFLTMLLDAKAGGCWSIEPTMTLCSRRYLEQSGVLETVFEAPEGLWALTDWMPMGKGLPHGICRLFSPAPTSIQVTLRVTPNYGRLSSTPVLSGGAAVMHGPYTLYASHALELTRDHVKFTVPQGEKGWTFLADARIRAPQEADIERWLEETLESWDERAAHTTYRGPYEREVNASLRVIRLLTFEETGSVIAAPTTSLPEVIGGDRNYDYRYVWLRDAGMIVSALTRAGGDPHEGARFLDFIALAGTNLSIDSLPLAPFVTPDGQRAPPLTTLKLPGFAYSTPVVLGNDANEQLQLDAYGNVLLAAKLLYEHANERVHWTLIEKLADFLCHTWPQADHGLWEEQTPRQYTSSKVIVACGLEYIADFSNDKSQAQRWRRAAQAIRTFVAKNCLTPEGAYAAVAGSEAVDVSAALFPVWNYDKPDSPEMLATMRVLERDYADGCLYRRHLFEFDARKEGAFLAGTLWVAQYWIMRGELERSRTIIDTVLTCANDLFLFSEEADPVTKRMLGNFPQSFVHAAFIGAVIDLKAAQASEG